MAADESVGYQRELWREAEQRDLEEIRKAGVVVIQSDVELFRERVQPLYAELRETSGQLYKLVQEIRSVADSTGR